MFTMARGEPWSVIMPTIMCNVLLIDSNEPSVTGKIYPIPVLNSIARKEVVFGQIKIDGVFYEADITDLKIDILKISHKVFNFEVRNGKLYGDVEFLDTPNGRSIENYRDKPLSVRPRGTGSISKSNVIEQYDIIAFDCYVKVD